jgi:hypothetical protein
MEKGDCFEHLKRSILSVVPIDNHSLSDLLDIFIPVTIAKDDYLCKAGDYSVFFAFVCKGAIQAFYPDHSNHVSVKSFFIDNMFVIPLPSFIYRKPSYLNYKAITEINLLQAKFSKLEELTLKLPGVARFVKLLIDREWIVNKELYESGLHIYNNHTRFRIFFEKYQSYLNILEPELISSYLNIPVKQIEKFIHEIKPAFEDKIF